MLHIENQDSFQYVILLFFIDIFVCLSDLDYNTILTAVYLIFTFSPIMSVVVNIVELYAPVIQTRGSASYQNYF